MRAWLQQWNIRRKLTRGQCVACKRILRDDETTRFCSKECGDEWVHNYSY